MHGWEQGGELGQCKKQGLEIIFPGATLFYILVSNKVAQCVPKANPNCSLEVPSLQTPARRILPGWEGSAGSGERLSAARDGAVGSKPPIWQLNLDEDFRRTFPRTALEPRARTSLSYTFIKKKRSCIMYVNTSRCMRTYSDTWRGEICLSCICSRGCSEMQLTGTQEPAFSSQLCSWALKLKSICNNYIYQPGEIF